MTNDCPYNGQGKHYFVNSVGSGTWSEFEPVTFGDTAGETLYKRVLYSLMSCNCGQSIMKRTREVKAEI